MTKFDVFNGDADGICALLQYRNAFPAESTLITGVKRDIKLVEQHQYAAGDELLVLDVSYDKNRAGVAAALAEGASVLYFDHHFAGDIENNKALETHINTESNICTALLMNGYLKGAYAQWAVVGAFGDNLRNSALSLAKNLDVTAEQLELLEKLGIYINYNGYGASLGDLHFEPADLYRNMLPFSSPLAFIESGDGTFEKLEQGYLEDMAAAAAIKPTLETPSVAVFGFPDEAWARRVSGVYSNDLANNFPARAHAVVTSKADGSYLISVRAPLNNKAGADELCRQFPTGGGRKAAAGINSLPEGQLPAFIEALQQRYV